MSKKIELLGAGFAVLQTNALAGIGEQGLAGAGTTQATATLISGHNNAFSTVTSNTGGALSLCYSPGDSAYLLNGGALTLKVYPTLSTDKIDNVAGSTGVTLTAARGALCVNPATGIWTTHKST